MAGRHVGGDADTSQGMALRYSYQASRLEILTRYMGFDFSDASWVKVSEVLEGS